MATNDNDPLGMLQKTGRVRDDYYRPELRQAVLTKLKELNREIPRVQNAARNFEQAVQSSAGVTNTRGPAFLSAHGRITATKDAVRNWILSLIESFGYIEMTLSSPSADVFEELVTKAVQLGRTRSRHDQFRAVIQSVNVDRTPASPNGARP
jgi:hypothetical protein